MKELYDLLGMEIESKDKDGNPIMVSPEFVVKVQHKTDLGIHVIIHANGHSSDTVDLVVGENKIIKLGDNVKIHHADKHKEERWLIYSKVGGVYFTGHNWVTDNPWLAHFERTEEEAQEYHDRWRSQWDEHTEFRDWCVERHLFIYK
ncbi:MAG: hypothetical protein OEX12_05800 [Gammaproteobacteria bacterium]|nr:hypothetical protein [Gammaproteobacteria bacterium]